MTDTLAGIRIMRPTPASLASALSAAVIRGDAHLAVQLAWRLIYQPDCPLRLQTHAVLAHSALSLRIGGRPQLIESNLRATIHRLAGGTELARLAHRGHLASWKLEALAQLQAALRCLRQNGEIPFRVHRPQAAPVSSYKRQAGLENVVAGIGKLELSGVGDQLTRENVESIAAV